ncbi:MAG: NlpC/P60 family protein [Bacillota bacterium]|nr:NlpC/P60 family protein [Bacillota bacterium]
MQRFRLQSLWRLIGRVCDNSLTPRLAVTAVAVLGVICIFLTLEKPEPRHLAYAVEEEAARPPFIVPLADESEAPARTLPQSANLAALSPVAITGMNYMPLNRSALPEGNESEANTNTNSNTDISTAADLETNANLPAALPGTPEAQMAAKLPEASEAGADEAETQLILPAAADLPAAGNSAQSPAQNTETVPAEVELLLPATLATEPAEGAESAVPAESPELTTEATETTTEPTTSADPDAHLIGSTLYVRAYDVSVYEAASTDAAELRIVQRGTPAVVCGFEGDFAKIELNDGTGGYLLRSLLQEGFIFPMWVRTLYCTTDGVDAREAANPELPPVHRFNSGDEVLVIGRTDEWFEVQRPNGYLMYCRNWHFSDTRPTEPTTTAAPTTTAVPTTAPAPAPTTTAAPAPTTAAPAPAPTAAPTSSSVGQRIVDIALSMRGPQGGYDCSAFVQEVYRRAGIAIPRSTYGYPGTGQNRSLSTAEPGDLILFDSLGVGHTTHVGIYLGGSEVVHVNTVQHKIMIQDWRPSGYPITGVKRYR